MFMYKRTSVYLISIPVDTIAMFITTFTYTCVWMHDVYNHFLTALDLFGIYYSDQFNKIKHDIIIIFYNDCQ